MLGRVAAVLAALLVLSLFSPLAAQVAAAPPDTPPVETLGEVVEVTPAESDSPQTPSETPGVALPVVEDLARDDAPVVIDSESEWSSVRPRGLEAPVALKQEQGLGADDKPSEQTQPEDPKPSENSRDEKRDPGDGPVKRQDDEEANRDRTPPGIRVWPMPADSYMFTQQFGCVPQLGNLYFPGEGCPPEAPVIHTGIDLAAPEGTVFYAAASGWVTLADYDRPTADANTRIIIQHDGRNERYATDYLHWVASYVAEGDYVHAGDPIGEVGNVGFSTGPHLHFSVTNLDTGEHIDPLLWLPKEPSLEGYITRRPAAALRLPPGTTAGQPESADPSPPEPAVRKNVPSEPPAESNGKRDRSASARDEKGKKAVDGQKRDESGKKKSRHSGKKHSGDESTNSEESKDASSDENEARDRTRERERTRERNKDGSSETDNSGESGRKRDEGDRSSKDDRHRNRETGDAGSGDENQKRGDDSGERHKRDGGDEGNVGRRDEPSARDGAGSNKDQNSSGDNTRGGGGGKERDKKAHSESRPITP